MTPYSDGAFLLLTLAWQRQAESWMCPVSVEKCSDPQTRPVLFALRSATRQCKATIQPSAAAHLTQPCRHPSCPFTCLCLQLSGDADFSRKAETFPSVRFLAHWETYAMATNSNESVSLASPKGEGQLQLLYFSFILSLLFFLFWFLYPVTPWEWHLPRHLMWLKSCWRILMQVKTYEEPKTFPRKKSWISAICRHQRM